MLGFVQNFFAAKPNPIGVDFGTDCLRLAQVQSAGEANEFRLVAAASADVPPHARNNISSRMQFFVETTRDLLAQGNFRGRQAILGLPAASMFIQHLRMVKLDESETKKALAWEARGKLPIDPSQAVLRHLIAGEIYQDQEPKNEVILLAAAREFVNQLLAAAAKAKLDVIGMNVEPKALVDAFMQIYRRKGDADVVNCYVDIGAVGTRAVIARGREIYFARAIPIGGDHLNRATSASLHITFEEAKMLRIKLCSAAPAIDAKREKDAVAAPVVAQADAPQSTEHEVDNNSFALLGVAVRRAEAAGTAAAVADPPPAAAVATAPAAAPASDQLLRVQQACADSVSRLVEELNLCRRYYEATFPNRPVGRLIFVGGEARDRALCQQIARQMQLAAQVGDPLVRMGRISDIGIESGIDRRQPQPGWAVAIGLSIGPGSEQPTESQQ